MCKVRNIVLLGSNDFFFLDEAEMMNRVNAEGSIDTGINFITHYGKPSAVYMVSHFSALKILYFILVCLGRQNGVLLE